MAQADNETVRKAAKEFVGEVGPEAFAALGLFIGLAATIKVFDRDMTTNETAQMKAIRNCMDYGERVAGEMLNRWAEKFGKDG